MRLLAGDHRQVPACLPALLRGGTQRLANPRIAWRQTSCYSPDAKEHDAVIGLRSHDRTRAGPAPATSWRCLPLATCGRASSLGGSCSGTSNARRSQTSMGARWRTRSGLPCPQPLPRVGSRARGHVDRTMAAGPRTMRPALQLPSVPAKVMTCAQRAVDLRSRLAASLVTTRTIRSAE